MRTTQRAKTTLSLTMVTLTGLFLWACGTHAGAGAGNGPGNDPDIGTLTDAADQDTTATDSSAAKDTASATKDATAPVKDTATGPHDAGTKPVDAGPAQTGLKWFETCGAPVCQGSPWKPTPGVPECTKGEKLGDPCQAADDMCDNKDSCKAFLVCATKDPKQGPGGCPISRRSFKTEIQYLSRSDEDRYARELQNLRLSTWVYRQGDDRKRLGIILEDSPTSIAVDNGRDRVDLYSYVSLAVAALKVQRREIHELRREVKLLRDRANPANLRCK